MPPKEDSKPVARNEMEGFLLGRFFSSNTETAKFLNTVTYPQGKIKKCQII